MLRAIVRNASSRDATSSASKPSGCCRKNVSYASTLLASTAACHSRRISGVQVVMAMTRSGIRQDHKQRRISESTNYACRDFWYRPTL